jgi:thymidine phosphorylase
LRVGTLFFVVGPSGSGKDSLIDGARTVLEPTDRYVFARRVITRPAGSAGEDHQSATEEDFARHVALGNFLISWNAHGLHYGLPASLRVALEHGQNVIANGSRAVIAELAERVPRLVVVEVMAPPELLAVRIAGRGRETGAAIDQRVARYVVQWPSSVKTITVRNDGTIAAGVERFLAALESCANYMLLRRIPIFGGRDYCAYLPANSDIVSALDYLGSAKIEISAGAASIRTRVQVMDMPDLLDTGAIGLSSEAFAELGVPEGSEVTVRRTPSPESRAALTRKIQGGKLSEEQYYTLIRDIVESRYPEGEVAAFLVAATQNLSDDEVVALARVRTRFAARMTWPDKIVVDKHSMGGIPGSRITLIVVPIVAAHGGFLMPKTSSRAITSAAGTADTMEALANVELGPAEFRVCLEQARACIAWNGRLNHSVVDDVMNAITRPLGIDSNRWSVASILSKKFTAGSTHVIVDLPFG